MGDLAPQLVYHAPAWVRERCSRQPLPLAAMASWRTDSGSRRAGEPALPVVCWAVMVRELAIFLTSCKTWESRPCTSIDHEGKAGPGCGGIVGFAGELGAGSLTNSDTAQTQIQAFDLAYPIYLINEPLETLKGLVLQTQNYRISMTQDTNRTPNEVPVLIE